MNNGLEPREAHENSRVETRAAADPIDYHQYNSETNPEVGQVPITPIVQPMNDILSVV